MNAPAAQSARRGVAYLTAARTVFLVSRLLYYFLLPRFLTSPSDYGNLVVVLGLALWASTLFLDGTLQAISKLSAEDVARAPEVRTAALASRFWICTLLAGSFLVFAGPLASLFGDPGLVPLLRLSSLLIAANGFYAVFLGYANGVGEFKKSAIVDSATSVLKLTLVLGLAAASGSALWAVAGSGISQVIGVVAGVFLIGVRPWRRGFSLGLLLRYELALMAFSFLVNLALRADLFLLKALTPAAESAALSGFYAAAQTFAQVPAILTVAVNLVIVPLVSGALSCGARDEAQAHVRQYAFFAAVVLLWVSVIVSGNASLLIGLVYPDVYSAAAPALEILVFGGAAYMLFLIFANVLAASGRPRVSLILAGVYLAAIFGFGFALIPAGHLTGAAWTHLLGGLAALSVTLVAAQLALGASLPWLKITGALLAAACAWGLARVVPGAEGGSTLLQVGALLGRGSLQTATFALLLLLTRTAHPRDLVALLKSLRGRAADEEMI